MMVMIDDGRLSKDVPWFVRTFIAPGWAKLYDKYNKQLLACVGDHEFDPTLSEASGCKCVIM
jgi:hypothetical protein